MSMEVFDMAPCAMPEAKHDPAAPFCWSGKAPG